MGVRVQGVAVFSCCRAHQNEVMSDCTVAYAQAAALCMQTQIGPVTQETRPCNLLVLSGHCHFAGHIQALPCLMAQPLASANWRSALLSEMIVWGCRKALPPLTVLALAAGSQLLAAMTL